LRAIRLNGPQSPDPQPPRPPARSAAARNWQVLLALLSLGLSLLLWLNGLTESLARPSVQNDLTLRQLELTASVAELLPDDWSVGLLGPDPRQSLSDALSKGMAQDPTPAPALRRLELALLLRGGTNSDQADRELRELVEMVDAPRRPLVEALLAGQRRPPLLQQALVTPWKAPLLVRQLSCEQLGGPARECPVQQARLRLLGQWLVATVLPLLLMGLGVLLIVIQLWRQLSGRIGKAPALLGPPLNLVEVTLLIAGGFVVVGEVLLPPLLAYPMQRLTTTLPPALAQGLQVLLPYLVVMAAPLLLLQSLLRGQGSVGNDGGLQWRWRPLAQALLQALNGVLTIFPIVALAGWLIERFWGDPGGSNPLLDLVLTRSQPLTLVCFALTAVVIAPLFEETLFRGVLLPVLGQRIGPVAGVVISALVFAIAHLSLSELAPLFLLGVGLGWIRWRSGRLAPSVLMHALWNGITFIDLLALAG